MKSIKWVVAGALVGFGGAALAQEAEQEIDREAEQVETEAQEAGEDVRTGLERGAEQTEQQVEENLEQAQEKVDETADDAAARAEEAGTGLAESISEASSAVQGERSPLQPGALGDGDDVRNTITTNAFGYFTGTGLNLQYSRPLSDKFSAVGGASFSRTSMGDGASTQVGVELGADFYILGSRNEGLRIGPRVNTGFGGETAGENSAFGRLGAAGELGYNWISSRGLTAGVGAGVGGNLAGSSDDGSGDIKDPEVDNFDADFSPYARLNLGYSW